MQVLGVHVLFLVWTFCFKETPHIVRAPRKMAVKEVFCTPPPQKMTACTTRQVVQERSESPSPRPQRRSFSKKNQKKRQNFQAAREILGQAKRSVPSELPTVQAASPLTRSCYEETIASVLRREVRLPEKGDVEIALTIASDGSVQKCTILFEESKTNGLYIQSVIPSVRFPPTGRKQDETYTLTLTDEKRVACVPVYFCSFLCARV